MKDLIIDMSLNASGVRDTARSLYISTNTVLSELKKKESTLESVNTALLNTLNPNEVTVDGRVLPGELTAAGRAWPSLHTGTGARHAWGRSPGSPPFLG